MNSVGLSTGLSVLVCTACLLGVARFGISWPFLTLFSFYWRSEIDMHDCSRQSPALAVAETGSRILAGLWLQRSYCPSVTLHVPLSVLHGCQYIRRMEVVSSSPFLQITREFLFHSTVYINLLAGQDGLNCSGVIKRTSPDS